MLSRKLLLVGALGFVIAVAATEVIADGYHDPEPSWMLINQDAKQPPVTMFHPNVYFASSVGWAWANWQDYGFPDEVNALFPGMNTDFNANNQGVTWGFLAGMQFAPHFAVELGGYDMFNGNRTLQTTSTDSVDKSFKDDSTSYFIYGAVKVLVSLHRRFFIYGKVGPVYRHIGNDNECTIINVDGANTNCPDNSINFSDSSYWTVFLAAGAEYYLTQNISAGLGYYFVPGNSDENFDDGAPAINAIVGILSYRIVNL